MFKFFWREKSSHGSLFILDLQNTIKRIDLNKKTKIGEIKKLKVVTSCICYQL